MSEDRKAIVTLVVSSPITLEELLEITEFAASVSTTARAEAHFNEIKVSFWASAFCDALRAIKADREAIQRDRESFAGMAQDVQRIGVRDAQGRFVGRDRSSDG